MRLLYTLFLYLILPLTLVRLLWRSRKNPNYRKRWTERLGFFPAPESKNGVWIHAVSVGETQAAEPLIKQLQSQHPELPIVITTTTPTGSDRVIKLFGDTVFHVYFPYDLPFCIRGFLRRVQPKILVMMETEIWPNLLVICQQQGIDTILANARLSEGSAKGYARLGKFTSQVFSKIGLVAAQSPADAERFLSLGVGSDRVRVTGSIKFDIKLPASLREQADVLRRQWGGRSVWVAASTHEGEDEVVLAAHRKVLAASPDALLVLVPRHPERFDRVAQLSKQLGFSTTRRTGKVPDIEKTAVFVGDTMGELPLFLAAADVAFVGGSLVPVGGHNILEPAALGLPVIFGPHMFNFSTISHLLLAEGAAQQVSDSNGLAVIVSRWLDDASERARYGENGTRVFEENRGSLDRLFALLEERI